MKFLKTIVIAIFSAFVLVGITNQFTSSKYPPCDLVVKGTNVSTYGCSNSSASAAPCLNLKARSKAQTSCINANYYNYKTFPFGFKQKFGPTSNLNDPKPKQMNELATFTLGFILTSAILFALTLSHKHNTSNSSAADI